MTANSAEKQHGEFVAVAGDLNFLVRFHDREIDREFIEGLRKGTFSDFLSVVLESGACERALADMEKALAMLSGQTDQKLIDDLASEYANIYLCHNYRIAPTGSVWLTEEKLERQEPMFAVRDWYKKYGVSVPDWRVRSDDHIAHELQFLGYLCELGTSASLADAAAFMDECMLVWIPDFATAVDERAHEPIYKASAQLTAAYLEELRDHLEAVTGVARPVPEETTKKAGRKQNTTLYDIDEDRPFVPGVAESW